MRKSRQYSGNIGMYESADFSDSARAEFEAVLELHTVAAAQCGSWLRPHTRPHQDPS